MEGEESLMELCLWTFRDDSGVIRALCLVCVDDFMLACSNLYEWRTWESRIVHRVQRTSHTSLRQTRQNMERI